MILRLLCYIDGNIQKKVYIAGLEFFLRNEIQKYLAIAVLGVTSLIFLPLIKNSHEIRNHINNGPTPTPGTHVPGWVLPRSQIYMVININVHKPVRQKVLKNRNVAIQTWIL